MDHYIDIHIRPDPEFPAHQLISVLYAKLHRALVVRNSTDIGVSFPGKSSKKQLLGNCMRLHGASTALSTLMESSWFVGMRDHVTLMQAAKVPDTVQHRHVKRVQVKSSPERLRRRLMHRHNIDAQEAQKRIPDNAARITHLPFIVLSSTSTGQIFKLFIEHGQIQPTSTPGNFNTYGLSQTATVPWF